MEFASDFTADEFTETTLVGRVDVLVGTVRGDDECARDPFLFDEGEAAEELGELVGGDDGALVKGFGVRAGAEDVGGVHAFVVVDGFVVDGHEGVNFAYGELVDCSQEGGESLPVKRPPQSLVEAIEMSIEFN